MKRHSLVALAFAAAVLVAIPSLSHAQVTCNLRNGICTGSSPGVSIATAPQTSPYPTTTCVAGTWYKAFAVVDLNPALGNGQARSAFFTVEYEGTPWGWVVDIGDSPTDNGYGGNSGGPERAAEVQVSSQQLTVYDDPQIPGVAYPLLDEQLVLTNGALKFGVADQKLAIGQPRSLSTSPTLFRIPDPNIPSSPARWSIYAGFNHVVDQSTSRYGCGARSVTIWTGTGPV